MRIGEVAGEAGVSTKTLRFYEERGLLPPPSRTASGYRDYQPDVVERLAFIRDAQGAGLTLEEITGVLALKDAGARTCEHTAALLRDHLAEVDRKLHCLQETRARLAELAERAGALDPAECVDPQRCQVIEAGRTR
jgi:DNA-binding transcriptional MerR regulator